MPNTLGTLKLIKARWLIDALTDKPMENGAVLIEGESIRQVGLAKDIVVPDGATVEEYDYPNGTIMPGLIDAHIHLNYPGDGTHTDVVMREQYDEMLLMRSLYNARVHLESGVTSARDCGGRNNTTFFTRDGIRRKWFKGPRLLVCGRPLTITMGHMWQHGQECEGEVGVRRAVRQLLGEGADFIKVASCGGQTGSSYPFVPAFNLDELMAITDEAHKFGKRVAAHGICTQAIVNCLDADVDQIIHCMFQEPAGPERWQWKRIYREDIAERIAREGKTVNTTLMTRRAPVLLMRKQMEDGIKEPRLPLIGGGTMDLEHATKIHEDHIEEVRRYIQAGINCIPGNDCGFDLLEWGKFSGEIECLVLAGMTPMRAIQAATREAAKSMDIAHMTGTLEQGKAADILVVDDNPSEDIKRLSSENVQAVFLVGEKVR